MGIQKYLIDTNIIIGLEDNHTVQPAFAALLSVAAEHGVDILVHEAARDDIRRDKSTVRRDISLSKLAKFQMLQKVRGLTTSQLAAQYGPLPSPNDVVDATLLHALENNAADFLITQDGALHARARRRAPDLGRRTLYVVDAVELLRTTFEPIPRPLRYVTEVPAHTILLNEKIFDGLREDYPQFDTWWKKKCVYLQRKCWVVYDGDLAGLVVRKDETEKDTDATLSAGRILKVSTFKVSDQHRGLKLGELLLKQVLWHCQVNSYELVYLTIYPKHLELIDLLRYYGFQHTGTRNDGEQVYEKLMSSSRLVREDNENLFRAARLNYPRFVTGPDVQAYCVPIQEEYHDTLFPDLKDDRQGNLFDNAGVRLAPERPGNTIRKVYLCRAAVNLESPGALLFFYKSKSKLKPSQALTAVGIFEEASSSGSLSDLARLAGGRSVYSQQQLAEWGATPKNRVKVINFILAGYISPPITKDELQRLGVFAEHVPQSVVSIVDEKLDCLLERLDLGFDTSRVGQVTAR